MMPSLGLLTIYDYTPYILYDCRKKKRHDHIAYLYIFHVFWSANMVEIRAGVD